MFSHHTEVNGIVAEVNTQFEAHDHLLEYELAPPHWQCVLLRGKP